MGINFPNAPSLGQQWPAPPVAGQPIWQWDGEKWSAGTSADSVGAVRYDIAQGLTSTQQAQGRSNIYAAPFDAMAYNGMQVNGSFEVSQEIGSAGRSISGGYICDGWIYSKAGTLAATASAYPAAFGPGFERFLGVQVTTPQASLGAGDYLTVIQPVEGYRVARLEWGAAGAQPLTLAFWSQHHVTGLYAGGVRNSANNRSYVFTYTQATAGTWLKDNGAGIYLAFSFGAGATYTAPSINGWLAGNYFSAPGQVNAAAVADWCRIAGVILVPGSEAPVAARSPFIMRPYDQELVMCQRYLWRWNGTQYLRQSIGYNDQTTTCQVVTAVPVPMRATPTLTQSNLTVNGISVTGGSVMGIMTSNQASLQFSVASGLTVGGLGQIYAISASGGFLQLDARL
jgi:hypothetical protein